MKEVVVFFSFLFSLVVGAINGECQPLELGRMVSEKDKEVKVIEVLNVKVGKKSDEIGVFPDPNIKGQDIGEPTGPVSFAVGDNGEIYVLDQENFRIQVFENGKKIKSFSIPKSEKSLGNICFENLDLLPEGKIALFDYCCTKSVYILGKDGEIISNTRIDSLPKGHCSSFTEIYTIRVGELEGVWLFNHSGSMKISDIRGNLLEGEKRVYVPGRVTPEGRRLLRVKAIGDITVVWERTEEGSLSKWHSGTVYSGDLDHIFGIWQDSYGKIFLGLCYVKNNIFKGTVVVLDSETNSEIASVKLGSLKGNYDVNRPVMVSPKGHIYHMVVENRRVVIRKYLLAGF